MGEEENSEAEERFILGENSLPPIDNMGTRKKSPILDFSSPLNLMMTLNLGLKMSMKKLILFPSPSQEFPLILLEKNVTY